jgi:hypothetical protein
MPSDSSAHAVDNITRAIRTVVEPYPASLTAAALAYELAAAIAAAARTRDDANAAIDALIGVMREQVERLGVGREHP